MGTGFEKSRLEPVVAGAMVLDGNPLAGHAFGAEEVGDLGRRLGFGDPVGDEASGLERTASLGTPRDQARLAEGRDEVFAEPRRLGRIQPAAETDARRHDHDVDGFGDQGASVLEQYFFIDMGFNAESRRNADLGPPAFERVGQILGPPLGGDEDPGSGKYGDQRAHTRATSGIGHISTTSSTTLVRHVSSRTAGSSILSPVRKSKTCLCMGEATVGTPPRVPTRPRAMTLAPL